MTFKSLRRHWDKMEAELRTILPQNIARAARVLSSQNGLVTLWHTSWLLELEKLFTSLFAPLKQNG